MEKSKELRILIITHKYFPQIAPRAFRWRAIVKEWTGKGIKVDVLCGANQGTKKFEILEGANILRVGKMVPDNSSDFVKNLKKTDETPLVQKVFQGKDSQVDIEKSAPFPADDMRKEIVRIAKFSLRILRKGLGFFIRLVNRGLRYLYRRLRELRWPDNSMYWILPAYRAARKKMRSNRYDAIITVSWPMGSHVVGYLLYPSMEKKNITWLVDVGDPFSLNNLTQPNNFQIYGRLNHFFEQKVLEKASWVSVTEENTKNLYSSNFKDVSRKIKVIPPLVTLDSDSKLSQSVFEDEGSKKLRLVYSGSLRIHNRKPDTLLQLFAELLKSSLGDGLELHLFGDIKQCLQSFANYENLLEKKIFLHGIVQKETVDQALREADTMVNIGNQSDFQIPSKVFDYMAINKPVLNISSIEEDTAFKYLVKSPLVFNLLLNNNHPLTEDKTKSVVSFLSNPPKKLSNNYLRKLLFPNMPKQISDQYLQLIY